MHCKLYLSALKYKIFEIHWLQAFSEILVVNLAP